MRSDSKLSVKIGNFFLTAAIICSIILSFNMVSCAPELTFGEIIICEEIDDNTFEPRNECDNFKIEVSQIFAAIKVSGVRAEDKWRFTWENLNTGEVIADSTNIYSNQTTGYIEGYFSNKLVPNGEGNIIAEPGNYSVSFYHNGELKSAGEFKISSPPVETLGVIFSKEINEQGSPEEESSEFFQRDTIFAAIKVNYRIRGDIFSIKWFKGEDELLEEESFVVDEDVYSPGFIVFQLINEGGKALPINTYRVEILHEGGIVGEEYFNIIPENFSIDIFSGGSKYINEDYILEFDYPDKWTIAEEEIESGLKVQFVPGEPEKNILINVWALKEDYSPEESDYINFADGLLDEELIPDGENGIEKTDNQKTIGDIKIYEVEYTNNQKDEKAWSITFNFIRNDDMLYLFMRLSDLDYLDYSEKILERMIGSLRFEDPE